MRLTRPAGSKPRRPARSLVVDDPAGIIQAGDPAPRPPHVTRGVTRTVHGPVRHPGTLGGSAGRLAGLGGTLPFDAGTAGLGTLAAISAASVAVTLLRRAYGRRRLSRPDRRSIGHVRGPLRRPARRASAASLG